MAANAAPREKGFVGQILRSHRPEIKLLLALALSAFAFWVFIEIAEEMREGDTLKFDTRLLMLFRNAADPSLPLGPSWLREVMRDITALGSTFVLLLVTIASVGFLALAGNRGVALLVLGSIGGGMVISSVLKVAFDRPRPDAVLHTMQVYSASFPSGHALMSAVVYLTLGALIAATVRDNRLRFYILALALVITLLVGISRVYLGVHWPTDVIGGWALGASWAIACWSVMIWLQHRGTIELPTAEQGGTARQA